MPYRGTEWCRKHRQGKVSRDDAVRAVQSHRVRFKGHESTRPRGRFRRSRYKVHEAVMVDGKPLTVDAAHSSTWTKRNGRWVCALHSESIEGDPFGRDRQAA